MENIKNWLRKNLKGDPQIWVIVFLLSVISLAIVYSAKSSVALLSMQSPEKYLFKHGSLVLMSLVIMYFTHKIPYRFFSYDTPAQKTFWQAMLWISVGLMVVAVLFFKRNEAGRWIVVPFIGMSFQPSDFAKLALIINLSAMLEKRQRIDNYTFIQLLPMLLWCALICGTIISSNASTAIMLAITCCIIMLLGGVPLQLLSILMGFIMAVGLAFLMAGQRWQTLKSRVADWWYGIVPDQIREGYIAIAKGGFLRFNPGGSQQRNHMPYAYADMVYGTIIEEYGMLLGGVGVLMLYVWLLYRGMKAVGRSTRPIGGILCAGLTFSIVVQALVHIGVVTGIGPATGQPLPMLSMGGTSLLFTGISIGIVLSVSRDGLDRH